MVFNVMDWQKDNPKDPLYRKLHPTQKPVKLLERLIEIFTDPGDIVIDPVAGSGSTLIAAENTGRKGFGFEINKDFYKQALEWNTLNMEIRNKLKNNPFSDAVSEINNPNQHSLF